MFVVEVEYWADGNPWTMVCNVFQMLDDALAYAQGFYGLWESTTGTAGEAVVVRSLTLDGASVYPDFPQVSTAIYAAM